MKQLSLLFSLTTLLFVSCGPSAEEVALQQKRRDDSIAAVSAARVQHKNDIKSELANLRNKYDNIKAELVAAKDKMNSLKEFHFLRTQDERADQIKKQSLYISQLEEKGQELENHISSLEQELGNM